MYDYLENPRSYVEGTAMSFAGLRNQDDRINILAYMRTLSNDPIDLPAPLAEQAEAPAAETQSEPADLVDQVVDAVEDIVEDVTGEDPAPEPPTEGGEGEGEDG
jgi:cytochrome c